jgi:MFS family permease
MDRPSIQNWRALLTEQRWLALWAATGGFLMDAMDVLLYLFAIQSIRAEFGLSAAEAGLVASFTMIASSFGGVLSGIASDRIGRRRTLIYTILLYSLASAGSASSRGLGDLLFWRALVGLGLGGEWSAGAVLVAETWPTHSRARAIGFMQSGWAMGYMAAAAVSAVILPAFGWRALFLFGLLPAFFTFFIRRKVQEPEIWLRRRQAAPIVTLFRPPFARVTFLATSIATATLLAYWGLFTWLPGFLAAPPQEGGAGFAVVQTSGWILAMQVGALFGYWTFGWLADLYGRRPVFFLFMVSAALLTVIYGTARYWAGDSTPGLLLILGPPIGFFGSGYFSLFGAMLAELYPTPIRGAGQGFSYNFGRGLAAFAPVAVGALADRYGLGAALTLNAAFFLAAAALIFKLPETRRATLEE